MSRVAVVADALATRWAALPAFADTVVQRGAPVGEVGAGRWLLVEHDATPDAREDSRWEQTWGDLAATAVEERGEITCSAVFQTGDDDIAAAEAAAVGMVNACVVDLASDRTLGGVVASSQVAAGRAAQLKNAAGIAVVVPFTVAYFATYAASAA